VRVTPADMGNKVMIIKKAERLQGQCVLLL